MAEQLVNIRAAGTVSRAPTPPSLAAPTIPKPDSATARETLRVGARVLAAYWNEKREFEGFWLATIKRIDHDEFSPRVVRRPQNIQRSRAGARTLPFSIPSSASRASEAGKSVLANSNGAACGSPLFIPRMPMNWARAIPSPTNLKETKLMSSTTVSPSRNHPRPQRRLPPHLRRRHGHDHRRRRSHAGRATSPGEAFQFDWSEDWAFIGGERTKLQVAHFKLSHSRAFILRAYPQQTHEMLFDAHNHAFRVLGGVPRRGIYDNMRTAVDKIGRGKERQVNARFSAMVSHFLFEAEFCNPASGWEKGQIEKNVQDARHRLWQPMPSFPSLAALNDWLEMRCQELWAQTQHGSQLGSVAEAWAEEARHLMPLSRPFDGFVEYAKRVSPTCLIHLERNRYSVPASFANRPVSVRVYPERVVVAAEGQIVCEHARVFARSHERKSTTTVFDWRHYLAVIQRKPGALRNGAPFAELPPAFRALQQRMLKTPGGDREMVEILALVLQHDEQAVLAAVELALEAGAPTKTHILNLLHRLVDGKPIDPLTVNPPNALTLTTEPQANVGRYDALRKAREARHAS